MIRVHVGSVYIYHACGFDRTLPPYDMQEGDIVEVRNIHGCPPANTLGHCYVFHHNGRFGGLVQVASLSPVSRKIRAQWRRQPGARRGIVPTTTHTPTETIKSPTAI